MKFNVAIDRDEDGIWIVECPSIPGCVTQGATTDEALANIEEAIRLCLEVRVGLQSLARRLGLPSHVSHFPPGTSK